MDTVNYYNYKGLSKVPCSSGKVSEKRRNVGGAYNKDQKILLVGEGDFSFSSSLAGGFGFAPNILATSLNNRDFLIKNYGSFLTNLQNLNTRGSVVMYGVDATTMATHPRLANMKFDRIIFNFPYTRLYKTDISPKKRVHQQLVTSFLKNAKMMIEKDGEIHVTHKSNSNGLSWNLPKLGSDEGLYLIQEVEFKPRKYPGYHNKYGYGGDGDFDCYPCKTYKFK